MEVFAYDGTSPLSHFVDCLYEQQNSLSDAADRLPGGDWLTLEEVCRDITANGDHGTKFQSAYHESPKAPVDKLTAAFDAHKELLKQAWIFSQGECSKLDFGLALSTACQAVSDLLPYLTPPRPAVDGKVEEVKPPQASPEKLFPKGLPANQDLHDCIVMLQTNRDGKTADMVWLLQFFEGNERKATLMQAEIARARSEGITTLPANPKRYVRS